MCRYSINTSTNRSLSRIPDGTTTLETLDGGSLTIQRTIDDIFSEGVTVRSSQVLGSLSYYVALDI